MKAKEHIKLIQEALLIPVSKQAPKIGPITRGAFERLSQLDPEEDYGPDGTVSKKLDLGKAGEGARDINDRSIKLIQHFESCFLDAYRDSVGVWTIGWGHTGLQHKDGTVYKGRVISQEKANQLFRYDMEQFEARVSVFVKVPLNDDQYGALVSFDFNTGGLGRSTLLRKLNEKDYAGSAEEFLKWDKAGGKVLRGLTRRRQSERRLFLGELEYIVKS